MNKFDFKPLCENDVKHGLERFFFNQGGMRLCLTKNNEIQNSFWKNRLCKWLNEICIYKKDIKNGNKNGNEEMYLVWYNRNCGFILYEW